MFEFKIILKHHSIKKNIHIYIILCIEGGLHCSLHATNVIDIRKFYLYLQTLFDLCIRNEKSDSA